MVRCFDDTIYAIDQKMIPSLDEIQPDLNDWLVGLDEEYYP
ncbi:hypothetical protein [Acinetobacter boissieri]|nr:hypothetical protein [Acinetobacter boissieri]